MATLTALPALNAAPPPDPLQSLQRLMAIKSMMGQQKMQDVQLQQAQTSQADQQATTQALRDWDGKDYTQIPSLVLKNGGSAKAVFAATQSIQDMKQKASEIAKNDAATNASNLDSVQKQNDQYRGRVLSIVNAPDEQKQSLWDAEVTKEEQAGAIKPGTLSHTYPGDDVATAFANHFALGSTLAKEASENMQAEARKTTADTAAGKFAAEQNPQSPLFAPTPAATNIAAQSGTPWATAAQAGAAKQAGVVAGSEAAAKFPWEARLEQMKQQGDPVFAYDQQSKQTVQVSRSEAQQAGMTNIVKVGQPEIDKAKTAAMQLGDATMNIQAYKMASQHMDELSGSDIATVSRVLGDSQFKAHFLGAELPTDWLNELYRSKGWQDMPDTAKDAVVNYLAARPAAISLLRAINPGVRLTESQIATELRNIPDPTTPSDIRDRQFARLDRNIDQASKTLVKIPGVDLPNEIRDRVGADQTAKDAASARMTANQNAQTGQYKNAKGNAMQVGQDAYDSATKRYLGTVSKVYRDGSYDVKSDWE